MKHKFTVDDIPHLIQLSACKDERIRDLERQLSVAKLRVKSLNTLLKRYQYADGPRFSGGVCIGCGKDYYDNCTHKCEIAAALADVKEDER